MDDRDKRTLYVGNLPDKATEELLFELFLQAGPLEVVKIPKDKSGRARNYAFVTFKHEVSIPYTVALMQGVTIFGRDLKLEPRSPAHQNNPYMDALQEHRMMSHGPRNASTPSDYRRPAPPLDRRHSYNGNVAPYLYSRDGNFMDPQRRYQGTPVASRTFVEGQHQPQVWREGHNKGFNPIDALRLGVSPIGFSDMKMRPFDNRFNNMSPYIGPVPHYNRNYH